MAKCSPHMSLTHALYLHRLSSVCICMDSTKGVSEWSGDREGAVCHYSMQHENIFSVLISCTCFFCTSSFPSVHAAMECLLLFLTNTLLLLGCQGYQGRVTATPTKSVHRAIGGKGCGQGAEVTQGGCGPHAAYGQHGKVVHKGG